MPSAGGHSPSSCHPSRSISPLDIVPEGGSPTPDFHRILPGTRPLGPDTYHQALPAPLPTLNPQLHDVLTRWPYNMPDTIANPASILPSEYGFVARSPTTQPLSFVELYLCIQTATLTALQVPRSIAIYLLKTAIRYTSLVVGKCRESMPDRISAETGRSQDGLHADDLAESPPTDHLLNLLSEMLGDCRVSAPSFPQGRPVRLMLCGVVCDRPAAINAIGAPSQSSPSSICTRCFATTEGLLRGDCKHPSNSEALSCSGLTWIASLAFTARVSRQHTEDVLYRNVAIPKAIHEAKNRHYAQEEELRRRIENLRDNWSQIRGLHPGARKPTKYNPKPFLRKTEEAIVASFGQEKGNISPIMLLPYADKFLASSFDVMHNLFLGNNKNYFQKGLVRGDYVVPIASVPVPAATAASEATESPPAKQRPALSSSTDMINALDPAVTALLQESSDSDSSDSQGDDDDMADEEIGTRTLTGVEGGLIRIESSGVSNRSGGPSTLFGESRVVNIPGPDPRQGETIIGTQQVASERGGAASRSAGSEQGRLGSQAQTKGKGKARGKGKGKKGKDKEFDGLLRPFDLDIIGELMEQVSQLPTYS